MSSPLVVLVLALLIIYLGVSGKGLAVIKVFATDASKITPKNKNAK